MKCHVSENCLFLSLEKPYDIALQFDFCTWENHHLGANNIRRTGTTGI